MSEPHPVYPAGPPCTDSCPGEWSTYHDGYSWGFENGQRQATAAARAEQGTTPDDAHVRTPEGPDDYCTGCGELWPCSFQRGVAAARAEVARLRTHLRNLAFAVDAENIDAYTDDVQAAYRAALLVEDAAPRQPEPEEPCPYCGGSGLGCMQCRGRGTVGSAFRQNRGLPPYQPAAPDTTTEAQQPPEVREPGRCPVCGGIDGPQPHVAARPPEVDAEGEGEPRDG